MTRIEVTHIRELNFSGWIRNNLPDSMTGVYVSDLDFIIENWKTKDIMLLEIKTRNGGMRPGQRKLFENLDRWINKGIDSSWTYHGFHVIKFENIFFNDGKVYFDGKESSEDEIRRILSFLAPMP